MSEIHPAAVVNVQPAPNYVTKDFLEATVAPMKDDIGEVKSDVKILLAAHAAAAATSKAKSVARDNMWRVVGTIATLCCGLLTGLLVH